MMPSDNTLPVPEWALDIFPRRPLMFRHTGNWVFEHIHIQMRVICSAAVYADGKRWMHVSCSRNGRLPDWDDLRLVKDTFIGRDRKAIQVLPSTAEHVNIHPYVLHLWSCLDGDGLPDFRLPDGSI